MPKPHPLIHAHWSAAGFVYRLTDASSIVAGLLVSVQTTLPLSIEDFVLAAVRISVL